MKFLCPQCKAKYQIADEKIEGRTLRMKCRRCEHEIVVRGDTAASMRSDAPSAAAAKPTFAAKPAAGGPGPAQGARKPAGATLGSAPAQPAVARKPAGSALGADFRRQAAGGLSDAGRSIPPTPLDAWHVAIHDVPVGPMKRDEVARKIAAGAVTPDSLVWREGMDDWRPLREVAELAPLLRRPSTPPAAAPAKVPPGGRLPPPGARPSPAAVRPAPGAARAGSSLGARTASAGARPAGAAAARGNVVAIGGRLGAAAAPTIEDAEEEFEQDEPTRISASPFDTAEAVADGASAPAARSSAPPAATPARSTGGAGGVAPTAPSSTAAPPAASLASSPASLAAPVPAVEAPVAAGEVAPAPFVGAPPSSSPLAHDSLPAPPRARRKKPLPIGAWVAIAGSGAFGITLAAMVGARFLQAPPPVAAVPPTAAHGAGFVPPTAALDVSDRDVPREVSTPQPTTDTLPQDLAGTAATGNRPTGGTKRGAGVSAAAAMAGARGTTKQLSEADRALLEQMGEAGASPSLALQNLARTAAQGAETGGPRLPEISAEMLRETVNRNRQSLQSCYELAARQTGSSETMRINVSGTVGGSGTVTRVTADGSGPPQLHQCVATAVRRWRFPGSGEISFPVVFSPGAR